MTFSISMVPKNPDDYSNSLGYYHFESVIGSLNGLKCIKVNGKLSFSEGMEKRGETFFCLFGRTLYHGNYCMACITNSLFPP